MSLLAVVVVAVVVHELAHVAAARAVGHDVFEIQIGTGPRWAHRVGTVDVAVGLLPLGGHVQSGSRTGEGFRWRSAVVGGSGVAANLALAGAGALAGADGLVSLNLLVAVANLWPGGRRRMGEGSTDGRRLLDLARGDLDAIAEERSGWYSVRALRAREVGDLDGARRLVEEGVERCGETRALLAVAGVVAFEQERYRDVVDAYAPLIDDDRVAVAGRAGFAADAALAALRSGDADLAGFALPWAEFAHRVRRSERRRMILAEAEQVAPDGPEGARR